MNHVEYETEREAPDPLAELAAILAQGIIRLQRNPAAGLDVSRETRLTVDSGRAAANEASRPGAGYTEPALTTTTL